jgi:hypothetical protein
VATYLLKASDEDMARWKNAARERGISFAEHVRRSLDGTGSSEPYVSLEQDGSERADERGPVAETASASAPDEAKIDLAWFRKRR